MKLHATNPGLAAEQAAAQFLQRQGLRLVTHNYSCRLGEVDLIMHDGPQLVFVEVRLRSHRGYTSAAESIDHRKQQKLIRVAQHYMQQHALNTPCRFDVVLFNDKDYSAPDWIRNAIDA